MYLLREETLPHQDPNNNKQLMIPLSLLLFYHPFGSMILTAPAW